MDLIKKQKKYLQYRDHYVIINNVRKTFSRKNFRRGCEAMGILRCPTSIRWDTIDAKKKKSFTKKKETRMDRTAAVWKMGTR